MKNSLQTTAIRLQKKKAVDRRPLAISGFTLVELMVVITIIISSGIIVLPRLTQFRASSEIEEEARRVMSVVKQTRTNAQSGAQCGDQFSPANKAISWKFITTTNSYSIEPSCTEGSSTPATTTTLKTGVTVAKVAYDNVTRSPTPLDVAGLPNGGSGSRAEFSNISGSTTFYDGSGLEVLNYKRMIVVIQSSANKTGVFIEKGGLIYTGAIQ